MADRKIVTDTLEYDLNLDGMSLSEVIGALADYDARFDNCRFYTEPYGYDGGYNLQILYDRPENDKEFEERRQKEEMFKEKKKKSGLTKEAKERKEYERLKKKFGV